MPKRYQIKAAGQGAAELLVYGDIGDSWWGESVTAKEVATELQSLDVSEITVRINSYGGSVADGLAIYNSLRQHKAKIIVHIDGVAVSIASLIAMAGDTVRMGDSALFMVHAPWAGAVGNAKELRQHADVLDSYAAAMAGAYERKTGKTNADVMALLTDGVDHYYTADEAIAEGFVDELIESVAVAASGFDKTEFFNAVMSIRAERLKTEVAAQVVANKPKEAVMPNKVPAATTTPVATVETIEPVAAAVVAPAASADEILAADQQRRNVMEQSFAPFLARAGVSDLLKACQNDSKCSVEAAGQKLLAKLGDGAEPVSKPLNIDVGASGSERLIADSTNVILARMGLETVTAGNNMRGMRLSEIARACLQAGGVSAGGMDIRAMVAASFTQSTSDFPVILENTMHKTLLAGYKLASDKWRRFCKVGQVSDFREHNRYRTGSMGNLDGLNELGEFENKTIPDGEKAKIKAGTKGNIINISRQAIINDDLDAFLGLSKDFGRAYGRTIEADVFAYLLSNPVLEDGVALFHATHGNLAGSGAAIGVATLEAGRVAMGSQKDIGGNDYLDIQPEILLCSLADGGNARVTVNAQYDPETANKLQKPNMVNGIVRDIVDTPRITTAWYMFANPEEVPTLEVAFLNGEQEPYLEFEEGFTVDGARMKVRGDWAIGAIDFRGAYRNAGA